MKLRLFGLVFGLLLAFAPACGGDDSTDGTTIDGGSGSADAGSGGSADAGSSSDAGDGQADAGADDDASVAPAEATK